MLIRSRASQPLSPVRGSGHKTMATSSAAEALTGIIVRKLSVQNFVRITVNTQIDKFNKLHRLRYIYIYLDKNILYLCVYINTVNFETI